MSFNGNELFNLLPAFYRLKDAQVARSKNLLTDAETTLLKTLQTTPPPLTAAQQAQLDSLTAKASRGPLESLLMVIAEQVAAVEQDLNQLYDDEFIETCAPWVIPYIGDLIGYQSVHGVAAAVASPRAEVANTISLRRRKGTVLVLEQLARDVTGWGAHAAEFFKRLGATQYMNHIRSHSFYSPNLRRWEPRAYMDTGFDATPHRVDVRRIASQRGRYNIQNIGIFLWSLNSYRLQKSTLASAPPSASENFCFRFSTVGRDIPLFNYPISQGLNIAATANPSNVADRLRRHVLCKDIQSGAGSVYYGEGKSLAIYLNGALLSPYQIQVCDLSGPDGAWINVPASASSPYLAAVDPVLGRLALPPDTDATQVEASYCYGFNGDMGGGSYPRNNSTTAEFIVPEANTTQFSQTSSGNLLDALLGAIAGIPEGGGEAALEITDDGIYNLAGAALVLPAGTTFEFRAADGCRPTLVLAGELSVSGGANSNFYLNGFILTSAAPVSSPAPQSLISIPAQSSDGSANNLAAFALSHCTLVPGWGFVEDGAPANPGQPTLVANAAAMNLQVAKSIVGTIWIGGQVTANISDSIIDATDPTAVAYVASTDSTGQNPTPGGALTLSGCTVIGKVYASLLTLVSNSVFWAKLSEADLSTSPPSWNSPLWASRQQEGCVRFSYLPEGAIVPRQFQCVEEGNGAPQPLFVSLSYGDPAYCKLLPGTDDLIRRGADDGGEMGAFHFVLAPLRETDLQVRLQEYMPVGLEFGIFYQT